MRKQNFSSFAPEGFRDGWNVGFPKKLGHPVGACKCAARWGWAVIDTYHCIYFAFVGSKSCVYITCAVNIHKSFYRPINSIHTTIPCQANHWQIAGRHCWFMFSLDFGKDSWQVVQCQLDFWFFKCMVFKIGFSRLL